ncbi:alkaline phosphatase [Rhodohalobacter sulfatireducens]|uniref:Alkaline phosphatase n=1 Tax=Rhodohalobacter sulfatireducens TaxID=2911366 RepID=A0ABS9KGW1_9BACT|nr:alkaline phosphatase [Rhodohalobacter sulfatireducens]MCG2590087.1 alkaline phosphatase [Rhodohalobacter sulfatireducens]
MNSVRKLLLNLFLFVLIASFVSCQNTDSQNQSVQESTPKNIIFLLGDGMGYPQITAAKYAHGNLNMTSMPYSGTVYTHSHDSKVTDSASSATAFACGFKTINGMLGVLPDGTTPVQSIAHYANELGKSTALMATSRITHATPAAYAIHHNDRGEEYIIAEKFVDSGIDMLLGAGSNYFLPESAGGTRPDDRNLISEMEEMGYLYLDSEEQLSQIAGQDRVIAFLEGGDLGQAAERGDQAGQLVDAAINQLSQNEEGFFMMIEGSQIDWQGHANEAELMIEELIDFDGIVGNVLDFAEQDGNTLVIVTADHETGGLTLPSAGDGEFSYNYSTGGHTAEHVPIFSFGPSAEQFKGTFDNTEIARKLFSIWGKEIQE